MAGGPQSVNRSTSSNGNVSFDGVVVYEFPIRLGDNPSCSTGCPIALGQKHRSVHRYDDVDSYQAERKRQQREVLLLAEATNEKKRSGGNGSKRRPSSSGNLMGGSSSGSGNNNNNNPLIASTSSRRPSSRHLMIPSDIRTKMLLEQGYDFQQVVRGTEACLLAQEQRKESLQKTSWEGVKSFLTFGGGGNSNNNGTSSTNGGKAASFLLPTPNRPTAKSA
jgi:hypothetical protein